MSREIVSSYKVCSNCGNSYEVEKVYEVDTWNLGNYGCTYSNCPRHLVQTIDRGCPECNKKAVEERL